MMAMTKAERAHVEALERELAFRWPTEREPERMPIPASGDTVEGWSGNEHSGKVARHWSQSHRNGPGRYNGSRCEGASQKGVRLYRTEADAYVGMRWAICQSMAEKLYHMDLARMVAASIAIGD